MQDKTPKHCDVLIAGGGLAGACLACALDAYTPPQKPWHVVVVDAAPAPTHTDQYGDDAPTTAISANTARALDAFGVWDVLRPHAAPIASVHVRYEHRTARQREPLVLNAHDAYAGNARTPESRFYIKDKEALGAVVETHRLLDALVSHANRSERVLWRSATQVEDVSTLAGGGFEVMLSDARVSTDLLAIADGPNSNLRQRLGIDANYRDYQRSALLLNMSARGIPNDTAYELFLEHGSMAVLPIPPTSVDTATDHSRVLVVRVAPDADIQSMCNMSDSELSEDLSATLNIAQARLFEPSARRTRPLKMVWAKEQYRRGALLVGDAAHGLHPIAAQGFNLSVGDIQSMASILRHARTGGKKLGDISVLAHYARTRTRAQNVARLLSDGLASFFANTSPLPGLLGGAGLSCLRYIAPLRRYFIRQATASYR